MARRTGEPRLARRAVDAVQRLPELRLVPVDEVLTHFYLDDLPDTIREWFRRTLEATDIAELTLEARYGRLPARVYLMGISNGGHVARQLLAEAPTRFDGGIAVGGDLADAGGEQERSGR